KEIAAIPPIGRARVPIAHARVEIRIAPGQVPLLGVSERCVSGISEVHPDGGDIAYPEYEMGESPSGGADCAAGVKGWRPGSCTYGFGKAIRIRVIDKRSKPIASESAGPLHHIPWSCGPDDKR